MPPPFTNVSIIEDSILLGNLQVAVDIGGKWLGRWTIFAAGISNLALFEAELSADAFQLMVCVVSYTTLWCQINSLLIITSLNDVRIGHGRARLPS